MAGGRAVRNALFWSRKKNFFFSKFKILFFQKRLVVASVMCGFVFGGAFGAKRVLTILPAPPHRTTRPPPAQYYGRLNKDPDHDEILPDRAGSVFCP